MTRKNKKGRGIRLSAPVRLQTRSSKLEKLFKAIKGNTAENIEHPAQPVQNVVKLPERKIIIKEVGENDHMNQVTRKIVDKYGIPEEALQKIPAGHFLSIDEKIRPLKDYDTMLDNFLTLLDTAAELTEYANQKYIDADRKKVDIEHNIELENENCYQTWQISRYLKYVLIERRDYKDAGKVLSILSTFANQHSSVIGELKALNKKLKQNKEMSDNRIYYPRSDLKLPVSEAFRKLPLEDQEVMRKNYEKSKV